MGSAITASFVILAVIALCGVQATLQTFSTSNLTLNTQRDGFCVVTYRDWAYAIGGYIGDRDVAAVERSTLTAAGKLTQSFEPLTHQLQTARDSHACVVISSYIYVIAGESPSASGYLTSIEYAQINGDGSIGKFTTASVSLPVGLSSPTANYDEQTQSLYIIGGSNNDDGDITTVYRAHVNNNGIIGAFALLPVKMNNPRSGHNTLQIGRSLVTFGGLDSTAVESATIHNDGSLSAFTVVSQLTTLRFGAVAGFSNGEIYAVGGLYGPPRPLSSVEFATVASNGAISAFKLVQGSNLVEGRYSGAGGIFGHDLVFIGGAATLGADILSSIEVALITAGRDTRSMHFSEKEVEQQQHTSNNIMIEVMSKTNKHNIVLRVAGDNEQVDKVMIKDSHREKWVEMKEMKHQGAYSHLIKSKYEFPISVRLISKDHQTLQFDDIIESPSETVIDTRTNFGREQIVNAEPSAADAMHTGFIPAEEAQKIKQQWAYENNKKNNVKIVVHESTTEHALTISVENLVHHVRRVMIRFSEGADWIALKPNDNDQWVFPSAVQLTTPISVKISSKKGRTAIFADVITSLESGAQFETDQRF